MFRYRNFRKSKKNLFILYWVKPTNFYVYTVLELGLGVLVRLATIAFFYRIPMQLT